MFILFQSKYGPVGLIHVDAHDDTADTMSGERVTHGTTIRRAGEQGCLDTSRVIQIGLRGSGYSPDDYSYGTQHVSNGAQSGVERSVG